MAKKVYLTREAILKARNIEIREVDVPEWGGTVFVRGMTGIERDIYEESMIRQRGRNTELNLKNARAKLVALCTVDKEGNRLFGDEDVKELGKLSAKALDRVYAVAQELSGISDKDIEEITKNSEEESGGDSF